MTGEKAGASGPTPDRNDSTRVVRDSEGRIHIVRFTTLRRLEHLLAFFTVTTLFVTGVPQKFFDSAWAAWLLDLLGGVGPARTAHRIAGYVFTAHGAVHIGAIVLGIVTRKMRLTLLPVPQDLRDAWQNLRYYLGQRPEPPKLPKFDYRQKFEYIGLILGGLIMIASGLILIYPVETATLLPGQVIPAARVAHSNEAMLALLVLLVWHVYGAHLSPDVFPMDKSIFTGLMPAEHVRHHHGREYERLVEQGVLEADERSEPGA